MAARSSNRASASRRKATTGSITTRSDTRGATVTTEARAKAEAKEGRAQRSKLVPLAKAQAEAQAKGYAGQDGADLGVQAQVSGVDGPGGHPNDPTSKGSTGAAS